MYSLSLIALLVSTPSEPTAASSTRALTLDDAVAIAVGHDPSVARAQILRERATLAELRANLDRFSVSVDAQLEELWTANSAGDSRGLGLSSFSARASVPVFSGFRVESQVERAEHLGRAAELDVAAETRATALAVGRAYWAARKLGLVAEVERRALERVSDADRIAQARVRAGLVAPIDERRTRARHLSQALVCDNLEGQRQEAHAQLAVALGISDAIALLDAPRSTTLALRPDAELLALAHDGRPELRAARARVDAARADETIAASGYYPSLVAYAGASLANNPVLPGAGSRAVPASANPFAGMIADAQLGAVLSINLFDTLHTHTAVEDARHQTRRAEAEVEQLRRRVDADVVGALARVRRLSRLDAQLGPLGDVARENVEIQHHRYESGEAQVFEVLDAEIELVDVERRRIDARAELTLASIELETAVGDHQ